MRISCMQVNYFFQSIPYEESLIKGWQRPYGKSNLNIEINDVLNIFLNDVFSQQLTIPIYISQIYSIRNKKKYVL